MAKRNRDRRWNDVRAERMRVQEMGRVKMRVNLNDIPAELVVEVYDEQGNLRHLSTTQASTEWQTVTEWLLEALAEVKEDSDGC